MVVSLSSEVLAPAGRRSRTRRRRETLWTGGAMQFGIFDQNDHGPYPLGEQYENRLQDRILRHRRVPHLSHERAPFDAAQPDTVAERVPGGGRTAHQTAAPGRTGLRAAGTPPAAARRRDLHAGSSEPGS